MSKTNRSLANDLVSPHIHLEDRGSNATLVRVEVRELVKDFASALDEAEKRGAKKEHKRIFDGSEGYQRQLAMGLIHYVNRQKHEAENITSPKKDPVPPFDFGERLRELLEITYKKGEEHPGYGKGMYLLGWTDISNAFNELCDYIPGEAKPAERIEGDSPTVYANNERCLKDYWRDEILPDIEAFGMRLNKIVNHKPVDVEHYRSEGQPYDVELMRDGAKVTSRVYDMPEESRHVQTLIRDDDCYRIASAVIGGIGAYEHDNILWLRGQRKREDDTTYSEMFPTPTAAREYYAHITALLDRLNAEYTKPAPQFDVKEIKRLLHKYTNAQCKLDHSSYREGLTFLALRDDIEDSILAALGLDSE